MIRNPERVSRLEQADELRAAEARSFDEALARFTALWIHARELNPSFGADWRADLEPDLAIARAVNGLPPRG